MGLGVAALNTGQKARPGGGPPPPTPSWNDTLIVNNQTNMDWEAVPDVNDDQYTFEKVIPYNVAAGISYFQRWLETSYTNPSGRPNVVAGMWTYNQGPGSSRIDASEFSFGFKTETYWQQSGTTLQEYHLPEIISLDGVIHRLWSMYVRRPDGFTYVQSQINSLSFRPFQDNSGTWEWFTAGMSEITGESQFTMSSTYGTGGILGTQTNLVRLRMYDGAGTITDFLGTGGEFFIHTTGAKRLYLDCSILNLSSYLKFNQGGAGAGQVIFELGSPAVSGTGYEFFDSTQAVNFFSMWKDGNISRLPLFHTGSATFAAAVFITQAVDPTDTATTGQIWTDGTDFFTYQGGVKKKFVLV